MKFDKNKIGLLTLPLARASVTPLSNLTEVLYKISTKFTLITGNEGYIYYKNERRFKVYNTNYEINGLKWKVAKYLSGQVRASILLIKLSRDVHQWIFFGGQRSIIPLIIAKLLNKKVVIVVPGLAVRESSLIQDKYLVVTKLLAPFGFLFADKLILYTPNLVKDWGLEHYRYKIEIAHRHFPDFNKFNLTTPLTCRPLAIGYIGRLSREKGIQNIMQALPSIFTNHRELRLLIGGDGKLKESIEATLKGAQFSSRVDLIGWISHDDLPTYLNQIRLLIIPSYTEGLPNVMIEAMACGTPILATSVGAIPDIIIDGKTGFILDDNSPECIAESVLRVLNSPDLEQVAENGRQYVKNNFTYEKVVERWRKIL